jgi:hypothetical protein
MIDDIRFHPRCPRERTRGPAVVVAMRHIHSNALCAVQRIYIDASHRKSGTPMMLGSANGCAMKLQQLQDGELHICEGLETGLATIAMDRGPVWALGSTSLIRSFPVLDGVAELHIWADHDNPGVEAGRICGQRWCDAGRDALMHHPRVEHWDEANVWSSRLARL